MSQILTIEFVVPFGDDDWGPFMTFYQWLPAGRSEALTKETAGLTARIWVDKDCLSSQECSADEYISRWQNVSVKQAHVDVEVRGVSDVLANFVYDERDSPKRIHHGICPADDKYARLSSEYEALGKRVLSAALTTYNQLIAFVRNHKGQSWLQQRSFENNRMPSMNNAFNATVSIEAHGRVRWCPPGEDQIIIHVSGDETAIAREEWETIQEFVASAARPSLTLELLANAERLMAEGYRRSALLEAASALELSIFDFGKRGTLEGLAPPEVATRFDRKQLLSQIEHMGLSCTVRFLLPILFPESVLPTDRLGHCQEVVTIRNNVIHQGQRDVPEETARPLLASVRITCEMLRKYTATREKAWSA